ncbi:hypothetical protein ACHAP8_010488 [Fusarium lateritium]
MPEFSPTPWDAQLQSAIEALPDMWADLKELNQMVRQNDELFRELRETTRGLAELNERLIKAYKMLANENKKLLEENKTLVEGNRVLGEMKSLSITGQEFSGRSSSKDN